MSKFDVDGHKNIWGSSYFTMQLLPWGCQHSWGSTQPSWSRAWGSSWNLHAVKPPQCIPSHCFCWGFSGISTLGPCTGRYQNIPLPTQRLVQLSSTKPFSDKNLLVGVSLSSLLLARIKGDLCRALTLGQLPQVLWIRCQIRREPSSARHETGSDEQGPTPAQLMAGQRGRHWHHSFASRISSHCKAPSCKGGKAVTI